MRMTTTNDEYPPPTEPREPSVADAAAIARAAGEAAASSETPSEAREATRQAVENAAESRNVTLSESDVSRIVDGLISSLEARGVFDNPEPVPAPTPDGSEAGGDAVGSVVAAEAASPPDSNPPRKRTFADKFMGRSGE